VEKKISIISKEFIEKLNALKLDLSPEQEDNLEKIEVFKKLDELSKLKENFLKTKLNLIETQESQYHNFFNTKFSHLELLLQDYKSLTNEYKVI
jgi:hypothetical protein